MCELLCLSSANRTNIKAEMGEFFSHSIDNPHGWGLAWREPDAASGQVGVRFVKGEERAVDSAALARAQADLPTTDLIMAHIRKATCNLGYDNSHPWQLADCRGKTWTFMHNGYLRDESVTAPYAATQVGSTDSERIFLHLMNRMDGAIGRTVEKNVDFGPRDALEVIASVVAEVCAGGANKVNLVLTDGERLYAHTNTADSTLHIRQRKGEVVVSTTALEPSGWDELPRNQVFVLEAGRVVAATPAHDGMFQGGEPVSFEEAAGLAS